MPTVNHLPGRFPALRFNTSPQQAARRRSRLQRGHDGSGPVAAAVPSAAAWVSAIERGQHHEMARQLRNLSPVQAQCMSTADGVPLLVEVAARVRDPGHLDWLLRLLLDHGAVPTVCDGQGNDALMVLLCRSDHPVHASTLLLRRGANVHHRNISGRTALHMALQVTRQHQLTVLQMLLARGVDLSIPTPEGITPLWLAARNSEGPAMLQAMLSAQPPDAFRAILRTTSYRHGRDLGNAGVAALMHNANDAACESVLALLARAGLDLGETQAQACALLERGASGRSVAAYGDRCRAVQERLSNDGLSLSPPKFQCEPLPQSRQPVPARPPLRAEVTPRRQDLAPPRFPLAFLPPLSLLRRAEPSAVGACEPQGVPAHHAAPVAPPALSFASAETSARCAPARAHPLEHADAPRAVRRRKLSPPA